MIEKLVALAFPPGFLNNGTTFQAKDRWHTGNHVRFFQGTIQPTGGYVQRTLTGATISGVPNAAMAWSTNDGLTWLAIGTTTHLYVVDSTNKVWDITPSFSSGGHPVQWQLDTFGTYLVACYNGTSVFPSEDINLFVWKGAVGVVAETVGFKLFDPVCPTQTFGVVVTPERFLFALQGGDPVVLGTSANVVFRASRSGAIATALVN